MRTMIFAAAALVAMAAAGCGFAPSSPCAKDGKKDMTPLTYHVKKLATPLVPTANWNSPAWRQVEPLELRNFMGTKPEHFPLVQARLAYDDKYVYVMFHVDDRYVRAVCRDHQQMVCADSCVEFFFTPSSDIGRGYFNLEMNCSGRILLCFQTKPGREFVRQFTRDEIERIQVAHTMPNFVDPEITEPTLWTVEYRIPLDVLTKYCEVDRPAPGVEWRANLYKCADGTSHPHWLTWSPVDYPSPRFHIKECFGHLKFE